MQLFDQVVLLPHTISQFFTSSTTDCTLPAPFSDVTGTCMLTDDCLGFKTPGLCPGASNIQCCTDTFTPNAGDSTGDISDLGLQLVKSFEGWSPNFYCDLSHQPPSSPRHCGPGEGTLTIGWGHACQTEPACDSINPPLSAAEGESLLRTDLQPRVSCVTSAVTVDLTQNQLDALVSFTYNEGCGAFGNVAVKLNADDFQGATDKMMEYNRAGGAVSPVLVRRRAIEVNMFNS